MLTDEQQEHFRAHGYLLLRGLLPLERVAPVRERIVHELERMGVSAKGSMPKSWSGLTPFQRIGKLSGLLDVPGLEARVVSEDVMQAVRALVHQAPHQPARQSRLTTQCQLLVSPPNQGEWTLQGSSWHTDVSSSQREHGTPIQAFVLLDTVEPHGGGTLILSGSQRVRPTEQGRIRDALRRGQGGLGPLNAEGLRVVELTGKAGDVYLMDMRVLHTPSINATKRFRMVATVRFFRA